MLITTYYSVIGDEVTYRIGLLLARYALSVQEISQTLGLPQPQVSHKLAKLRKHDCVTTRREGKRVFYRFREPCRSILLDGDYNWRKLNPEFGSMWQKDHEQLAALVGDELERRMIHPVIDGSPSPARK